MSVLLECVTLSATISKVNYPIKAPLRSTFDTNTVPTSGSAFATQFSTVNGHSLGPEEIKNSRDDTPTRNRPP